MNRRSILLWDLPTRLAHWSLAVLLVASVMSVKIGGNAMLWHGRCGLAILGVVVFRIVWGAVGSTYARFLHFLPTPRAIADYFGGRWRGVGHNPLGALSVIALLALMIIQSLAGLFANDDIAFYGPLYQLISGDLSASVSGWHRRAEWIVYGLVALHVGAVMFYTHVKKDNLIVPMIKGTRIVSDPGIEPARGGGIGALVFAVTVAALAVWVAAGGWIPPAAAPVPVPAPAW